MDDHVLLLGSQPLTEYLQYVRTKVVGGSEFELEHLVQQWRAASSVLSELQKSEAHLADNPGTRPLSGETAERAERHLREAHAARSLFMTPHRWALVELDRLVVYQNRINLSFVDQIQGALSVPLTADQMMGVALSEVVGRPPLIVKQIDESSYGFACSSNDLRLLRAATLDPDAVNNDHGRGHTASVLSLFVGFGFNWINALEIRDRLILINGSHRAFALKALGATHAPCLVQRVADEADLDVLGFSDVKQKLHSFLRLARPPLFKDYFDDRLTMRFRAFRTQLMLRINVSAEYIAVPV